MITAKDLLETSPLALMIYLDMSLIDAKKIINQACNRIASEKNHTALELLQIRLQQNFYLSTGLKDLDVAMRGGISIGTISEICGPPGVGKTQLCIGCCVQAVVMNHTNSSGSIKKGGVIYIDTELKFDSMRLTEVAAHCFPHIYNADSSMDAPHQIDSLLDCVKIMRPKTCKELLELIEGIQPLIIEDGIKLIVLDSIAALARKENLNETDKELFIIKQAALLKKTAELCSCAVLVTNQITIDNFRGDGGGDNPLGDTIQDIGGIYRPTLGPAWHHCVSTRLTMFMTRGDMGRGNGERVEVGIRTISLTKSPIAGIYKN
jgi:RAD51-like protein 1